MSIIDYVNTYTDEGVTTADDILGKIRAEIEQLPITDTAVRLVTEIIDKYWEPQESEATNADSN